MFQIPWIPTNQQRWPRFLSIITCKFQLVTGEALSTTMTTSKYIEPILEKGTLLNIELRAERQLGHY
jgi:hypothetical protein